MRLLLGEDVRGTGDDAQRGVRQRVDHVDGVPQGHQVVVGEHHERAGGVVGPRLFTTPETALDLRVGGRYRFTVQPPEGEPFHLAGTCVEVGPPARLASTFGWDEPAPDDRETFVRPSPGEAGGVTDLSVRQGESATGERLDLRRSGWTDSLDRLVAFLGEDG